MSSSFIHLIGCRQHNLKNFSLKIPKQAVTVLVGVSGSGKSSLAFDILFAEGQRRYLQYLSPQLSFWIKQLPQASVDLIEGLSPTLAVGQKNLALSSQGTAATYTDIYDFLSLLYATIGTQHSPLTGKKLTRYSRQEMVDYLLKAYPLGTRLQIFAPIKLQKEPPYSAIARLEQMGFIRLIINGKEWTSDDLLPLEKEITELEAGIDRLEIKEEIRDRLASSLETALDLSQGIVKIREGQDRALTYLTEIYVCPETGFSFSPLQTVDFNFNSRQGACSTCQGLGGNYRVEETAFIFDPFLSLGEQVRDFLKIFPKKICTPFLAFYEAFLKSQQVSEQTLVKKLSQKFLTHFLYANEKTTLTVSLIEGQPFIKGTWEGLIPFFNRILKMNKAKEPLDHFLFICWQPCPTCKGLRLKIESLACLIQGLNISQACQLSVDDLIKTLQSWTFEGKDLKVAQEILPQLKQRLVFLQQVGLGYLTLDRTGKTLSSGESQRLQLASQIGTQLSGLIYILDEPSLGLHRQDVFYLQQVIKQLKKLGNTVVIVEHEQQLIQLADYVVELGPGAGQQGGHLTFAGSYDELLKDPMSLTGLWLSHKKKFLPPPFHQAIKQKLQVTDATLHHLNHLFVEIPLGCLVGICGVSGAGKSTLALDIIGRQVQNYLRGHPVVGLSGLESIQRLVLSEKASSRLNFRSFTATYVNLMTPLRQLFAETRLAKARGYQPCRFSLNKKGGRCEVCEGLGFLKVDMELMADLQILCEVCQGKRYNYETLQVTWENRNLSEVLNLSIKEAASFFRYIPSLAPTLELMQELGLSYLTLGQSFNTLSGGEIQRLRLVADLAKFSQDKTLYILDEPSAGLHFEDIEKLILILHRLIDQGHSVIIIEHHLELLCQANWLIELGPGGGPQGGNLLFQGTPLQLANCKTPTALLLKTGK